MDTPFISDHRHTFNQLTRKPARNRTILIPAEALERIEGCIARLHLDALDLRARHDTLAGEVKRLEAMLASMTELTQAHSGPRARASSS